MDAYDFVEHVCFREKEAQWEGATLFHVILRLTHMGFL